MQYLTLVSNFIYLLCGFYLIYKKHYIYGLLGLIIWLISHIYHSDNNNDNWNWKMNADIIISSICFIFVLVNCHPVLLCVKNMCLLIALLLLFIISYYYYYIDMNKYYIYHSLWHVCSAFFILYLIIKFYN